MKLCEISASRESSTLAIVILVRKSITHDLSFAGEKVGAGVGAGVGVGVGPGVGVAVGTGVGAVVDTGVGHSVTPHPQVIDSVQGLGDAFIK